ncbi:MAG: GNAT family N-acetyltransferase, partial [Bacillota bacterium]
NSFYAILYMNGDIAAFASALICRDKRIYGIRFAISSKYARYSPGGLLISEMVRHLIEQNTTDKQKLLRLDMGEGVRGGMSYKHAYGGVTYQLYHFTS